MLIPAHRKLLAWSFRDRFLVPVRGYAKEGDTENVEFVGIAASS
jgi:hypothetical protein